MAEVSLKMHKKNTLLNSLNVTLEKENFTVKRKPLTLTTFKDTVISYKLFYCKKIYIISFVNISATFNNWLFAFLSL